MERELNLAPHAYALNVSGYTLAGPQIEPDTLSDLRGIADAATAAASREAARGRAYAYYPGSPYFASANVLYCWGDAALALLDHPFVVALADALLGDYRLNDISVFSALPSDPAGPPVGTTSWHRDCPLVGAPEVPGHLWFLFLLDDFEPTNGATWMVPGSHRPGSPQEPELGAPWQPLDLARFPSRVQLLGRAGDLAVMDARVIHSSGSNHTNTVRRMINVGLVPEQQRERLRRSHWRIAGPAIQPRAGARLRRLLGADLTDLGLGDPPSLLPPDWITG